MDGTLIEQNVDFAELRRRIDEVADADPIGKKLDDREDLAETMSNMSLDGQRKTRQIIGEILQIALERMAIQEGGPDLVAYLAQNGIRRAILTRNYEKIVFIMQRMYLDENSEATFDLVIGRDTHFNGNVPTAKEIRKAERILQICEIWGCSPSEVVMVGDSIKDDIVEGNRAGCGATVLLEPKGYQLNATYGTNAGNPMERKPTVCIEALSELKLLLEDQMNFQASCRGIDRSCEEGGIVTASVSSHSSLIIIERD